MNVTVCPITDGFPPEERTVVVAAGFTASTKVNRLLPVKLLSRAYRAEMACVPAPGDPPATVSCAVKHALQPICVLPSKKATVPVVLPLVPGRTVVVNVETVRSLWGWRPKNPACPSVQVKTFSASCTNSGPLGQAQTAIRAVSSFGRKLVPGEQQVAGVGT